MTTGVVPPAGDLVRFIDVGASYRELRSEVDDAVGRVLASGCYILGPEVEAFESEFAQFVGSRHCITVGSGLDALELSLSALGVGAGDEVIVPANTFIATWLAVTRLGAVPVPVEPDPHTYNLAVDGLSRAIGRKTKAIVAVHLYGQPADVDAVRAEAGRHGIAVVEDAAQGHGARLRGIRAGSLADAAAWSFYPAKNLGCFGDGGAVTTDRDDVADRVRLLRNYGSRVKYHNDVRGVNSRLDEIQSAVLRIKLRRLDSWNERRSRIANRYLAELGGVDIQLPHVPEWAQVVWHVFVIQTDRRDELSRMLAAQGIETAVHYPVPPHRQLAYRDLAARIDELPITDAIHRRALSLPIGPHLTDAECTRVVRAVLTFFD